jgi:hypothetical protein
VASCLLLTTSQGARRWLHTRSRCRSRTSPDRQRRYHSSSSEGHEAARHTHHQPGRGRLEEGSRTQERLRQLDAVRGADGERLRAHAAVSSPGLSRGRGQRLCAQPVGERWTLGQGCHRGRPVDTRAIGGTRPHAKRASENATVSAIVRSAGCLADAPRRAMEQVSTSLHHD